MRYKSPFLQNIRFTSNDTFDIWDLFDDDNKNRLIKTKDTIHSLKEEYDKVNKRSSYIYINKNENNFYDDEDEFKYFLTLFSSEDDSLLSDLFDKLNPLEDEIIFLLEDNQSDFLSGASYYVKMGDHVHQKILANNQFVKSKFITQGANELGIAQDQLSLKLINQIIDSVKEKGEGKYHDSSTYDLITQALSIVSLPYQYIVKAPILLIDTILDGIQKIKIKNSSWDYTYLDKNANLFFFPFYQNLKDILSEKNIDVVTEKLSDSLITVLNKLKKLLQSMKLDHLPKMLNIALQTSVIDLLIGIIDNFILESKKFTKFVSEILEQFIFNGMLFVNGMLCGIYNSLISAVEGVLFIIKLAFTIKDKSINFILNPEVLDETIQKIQRFEFSIVIDRIKKFLTDFINLISDFDLSELIKKTSAAKAGYFIGGIIEFIIETILEIIFTGGVAAVATAVNKLGNTFIKIVNKIIKIVRNFFKFAKDVVVDLSKVVAKIFAKGANNFVKLMDEIWDTIKKWVDELLVGAGKKVELRLKGKPIILKGFKWKKIKYIKRNPSELNKLRNKFNNTIRKQFIEDLLKKPNVIQKLKKAGLSADDIDKLNNGFMPKGWNVHHKIPLDDGGTNTLDNLILIDNEPYHKALTVFQNSSTRNLKPNEILEIEWPVFDGYLYP